MKIESTWVLDMAVSPTTVWSSGEIAQTLFKPPGPPLFLLEALEEIINISQRLVYIDDLIP